MTFSLLLDQARSLVDEARRTHGDAQKRTALLLEARVLLVTAVEVAALYEAASRYEPSARGIPAFEFSYLDVFDRSVFRLFVER